MKRWAPVWLLLAMLALSSALPFMAGFSSVLNRGEWVFNTLFAGLTIFFAFFYTSVTFQPVEVADHLKETGR